MRQIRFTFFSILLACSFSVFGNIDTSYAILNTDVIEYYGVPGDTLYRPYYYHAITKEPFNGWVMSHYKNKSVTVFDVRNGYQEGFRLYYTKRKSQYTLGFFQYYHNGIATLTAGCNNKKFLDIRIRYLERYDITYTTNRDSTQYSCFEFSIEDSVLYKSEIICYPKNPSKPNKGTKVKIVRYPSLDINDSICFTFCSNLLTNFPLNFKDISEFPPPPKFHIQNSSCGPQRIPVFNYKYAYPLSE